MAVANPRTVPSEEELRRLERSAKAATELKEELFYVPPEERLGDILAGPRGARRAETGLGTVGRFARKWLLDPFYKAGAVTERAMRGQPPTPQEALEVAAMGLVPSGSGGLGSGPRLARPFRSRLLETLRSGRIGKRELGKAPKAQSLLSSLKRSDISPDELKFSGLEKFLKGKGQERVPMTEVVARAEKDLPLPVEITHLGEPKVRSDVIENLIKQRRVLRDKEQLLETRIYDLERLGRISDENFERFLDDPVRYKRDFVDPIKSELRTLRASRTRLTVGIRVLQKRARAEKPRYEQHVMPGESEKYRETLFHWRKSPAEPFKGRKEVLEQWYEASHGSLLFDEVPGLKDILTNPRRFNEDLSMTVRGSSEVDNLLADAGLSQPEINNLRAHLDVYKEQLAVAGGEWEDPGRAFRSPHFDERGESLLGHMRSNVRRIQGKKVTHMEGIQSDWLQSLASHPASVPEAPFVKTWPKLMARELVNQAYKEGSEGITWTTGRIQAERWSPEFGQFYENLYDKKLVKFFESEYGVKAKKVRSGLKYNQTSGRTGRDDIGYFWEVEVGEPGSAIAERIYSDDLTLVEDLHRVGASDGLIHNFKNRGFARFYNEQEAEDFAYFYNKTLSRDEVWYVPFNEKMRKAAFGGQFQARVAGPRRRAA